MSEPTTLFTSHGTVVDGWSDGPRVYVHPSEDKWSSPGFSSLEELADFCRAFLASDLACPKPSCTPATHASHMVVDL